MIALLVIYTCGNGVLMCAEMDEQSSVRTRLAAHEYPRHVEFLDALPMTTTGKIQYNLDLLKLYLRRLTSVQLRKPSKTSVSAGSGEAHLANTDM